MTASPFLERKVYMHVYAHCSLSLSFSITLVSQLDPFYQIRAETAQVSFVQPVTRPSVLRCQ